MDEMGKVLDELNIKIQMGKLVWEERLRLHLNPKPKWLSDSLWHRLVQLVVSQSIKGSQFTDYDNDRHIS